MLGKAKAQNGKGLIDLALFKLDFKMHVVDGQLHDAFKAIPTKDKQIIKRCEASPKDAEVSSCFPSYSKL